MGIIVTVIGTIGACLFNMDDITNFLYLIGSVFAPMIAVQLTTYFILKKDSFKEAFDWPNLIVWLLGFIAYRLLMNVDLPVGNTLPAVVITWCSATSSTNWYRPRPERGSGVKGAPAA